MHCKICGMPFTTYLVRNRHHIGPNCKCGKIRALLRETGCIRCGHNIIDMALISGEYIAKCRKCAKEWWIRDDII